MQPLHRLARHPVVHFAIAGAVLFALVRSSGSGERHRIEVDDALLASLRGDHLRRTGTIPSPAEERAIVDRWVDEEVLYREALALGLDRGDVIVRRRLVQKMEFVADSLAQQAEPDDAELAAYLAAHAERYAPAARVSFAHVFVAADRHGPRAEAIARELRDRLLAGDDPAALGDPFLRGREVGPATEREIAGAFGAELAARVIELPPGEWSAPLRSSYGLHLVRVAARSAGEPPRLDLVRDRVRQDWEAERAGARRRAALDELRRRYEVEVAGGAEGGGGRGADVAAAPRPLTELARP